MNERLPDASKLEALKKIDQLLAASPDLIEERYHRACLLEELGRTEEAKLEFGEVLKKTPAHFGSLTRLGNLLFTGGFKAAARALYQDAVLKHPSNPVGYINLANSQLENGELEKARSSLGAALRLDPENWDANQGMAFLLTKLGDNPGARPYWDKAFRLKPVQVWPYTGKNPPVSILFLASAWGGLRISHHFDTRLFQAAVLFVEYFDPTQPLPPHQKVMNAMGDVELSLPALKIAVKLLRKTSAPILNHPSKVIPTSREEISKRLGAIPGVIAPRIASVGRGQLMGPGVRDYLNKLGFSFPFLLRSPGFHGGQNFIYVENEEMLKSQLKALPGKNLLVIQYLDSRSPDGKTRKYRVMMIDRKLYPLHAAVSHKWKIHFFSAEMAESPENREEDLRFLNHMPEVLGKPAVDALEKICSKLGLDYAGIDFSLNSKGEILLFEANATMLVQPPEPGPKWDYRRPGVQKILDAVQQMLLKGTVGQ